MESYDLIVVGTGAGTKLVQPVAKLGKKVCVVEKDAPGGTCLNRGCIPSKMLIYPAELLQTTKDRANRLNLKITDIGQVHFTDLIQRISQTVDAESKSIPPIYKKNPNITLIHGEAKFESNHVLSVQGRKITAPRILLAVGCRPEIPSILGLEGTPYWTSREALRQTTLPKSLTVLGGGYIGLELGFAYSALGSELHLITRRGVLRKEDMDIRTEFLKSFRLHNTVHENAYIDFIEYKDQEFWIHVTTPEGKQIVRSEALLVATGIVPNTDTLDLGKTDLKLNPQGYLPTDSYFQTNVEGIYALGDVRGVHFFRHSANWEGEFLFENLYKRHQPIPFEFPPVPHAVFTHPQIASVGKTEDELIATQQPYVKGLNFYSSSAMGMARQSSEGFVKLLVCPHTQKFLGVHIIGDEASNLIQLFVFAMTYQHSYLDVLNMIYIHPALPEVSRNALRKVKEAMDALQPTRP